MLVAKTTEIEKYENDLKKFRFKAYPFATRETLNATAFKTRSFAQKQIARKMTIRNKFTIRSIQVHKSKTLQLNQQSAFIGSTQKYMERQEFGAIERSQGKVGLAIPTSFSAGQEGSKPRSRLPTRANKLKNITTGKQKIRAKTRRTRTFISIQQAARSKQRYLFLDLGRRKGIFKIEGKKDRIKIKMVHDLSNKSVTIRPRPWLKPATKAVEKHIAGIYQDKLIFQLKRNNLFK